MCPPRHGAGPVPQRLRVARHTDRLDAIVGFYRDRVGLPELGRFTDHDGYDGVFLDVPGTGAHLEFTTGGPHPAAAAHPEELLVLYLGDDDAVKRMAERIDTAPVTPANPYWQRHAMAFVDPDGRHLVLVGRDDAP
jgi:catechol 2,3-dioxygenase-like lactoylglutathione lyase family enzyme